MNVFIVFELDMIANDVQKYERFELIACTFRMDVVI